MASGPAPPRPGRGSIDDGGATIALTGNRMRVAEPEFDGSAVLGDPRVALAWLVNELGSLGLTLEAGRFVTTGTCMAPLEVQPGDTVHADYGALGTMSLRFSD